MPEIKEFGPIYAHLTRLQKGSSLIHRYPTHEIDEPFRVGSSVIFRLWPTTHALVLGRWVGRQDDEDLALLGALQSCGEPRQTATPYWCEICGRSNCVCEI